MANLQEVDEQRLDQLVAEYLRRMDRGEQVDVETFLAPHPDLAATFRQYLDDAAAVDRAMEKVSPPLTEAEVSTYSPADSETMPPLAAEAGSAPQVGSKPPQPPDRAVRGSPTSPTPHSPATEGLHEAGPASGNPAVGEPGEVGGPAPSARPGQMPALPERLGRYRIVRLLGQGAMGSVFLAEDTELRRRVALKVPKFAQGEKQELLERFYREARAAATLRHPNICPVYDIGEEQGIRYITMGYLCGPPLASLVGTDKLKSERTVVKLLRRIAAALAAAHAKGIVHRDLKPGNILFDERHEPVVTDFGLACRMDQGLEPRLTLHGALVGTPAYMAPEQVSGEPSRIGPPCDVYALGVILYELLTGQLPYRGSIPAVLAQILQGQPKRPSELRPDLDPRLEVICLKLMASQPGSRYASAADAANALGQWLEQAGAAPGPSSPPAKTIGRPAAAPVPTSEKLASPKAPAAPPHARQERASRSTSLPSRAAQHWMAMLRTKRRIGAVLLVIMLLGGIALGVVFKLRTRDGTLVVEVSDPQATVQIFDAEGRVEIARPATGGSVTIDIDPGQHRLRVEKDGLTMFTRDFMMEAGGRETITARWEPKVAKTEPAKPTEPPPANPPTVLSPSVTPKEMPGSEPHPVIPADVTSPASVDLLKLIDPDRDTITGEWQFEAGVLVTPRIDLNSVLAIPYSLPEEYLMTAVVERVRESIGNFSFHLPFGPQLLHLWLDGWPHEETFFSGLTVDGRGADQNETRHEGVVLPVGARKTIRCLIRRGSVIVEQDGQPLTHWRGDVWRVGYDPLYGAGGRHRMAVQGDLAAFRVHELTVMPVSGGGAPIDVAVGKGWKYLGYDNPAREELVRLGRTGSLDLPTGDLVDVLRYVDVGANVSRASAMQDPEGFLVHFTGGPGTLSLPVCVQGDYDLETTFTRLRGVEGVGVHLPVGGQTCVVVLGGWGGRISGLCMVGGRELEDSLPWCVRPGTLENGRRYTALAQVRQSGEQAQIKVQLDGQDLVSWSGKLPSLSIRRDHWMTNTIDRPGVAGWMNTVRLHRVRFRPVSGHSRWISPGALPQAAHAASPVLGVRPDSALSFDIGPAESRLVGFKVLSSGEGLQCLQPIYRTHDSQVNGRIYRPNGSPDRSIVAKEGYAIGGIAVKTSDRAILGMRLLFHRELGEQLDAADSYQSEWIGSRGGEAEVELPSDGRPITGVLVGWGPESVSSLGWLWATGAPSSRDRGQPDFVRLTAMEPVAAVVGWDQFDINTPHSSLWPTVPRDFKVCRELIYAHAPSQLKFPVSEEIKGFTAVGYCWNGAVAFKVLADARVLFESERTGMVPIRLDIPAGSKELELLVDPLESSAGDWSCWLAPRLHRRPGSAVKDLYQPDSHAIQLSEAKPTFANVPYTAPNTNPAWATKQPLQLTRYRICPEFLWAHAPSRLTYVIPAGAREFSAIGHVTHGDGLASFQVYADGKLLHQSPSGGVVPISVSLPEGAQRLDLVVDMLGASHGDHAYWCYPRFYWKPQPPPWEVTPIVAAAQSDKDAVAVPAAERIAPSYVCDFASQPAAVAEDRENYQRGCADGVYYCDSRLAGNQALAWDCHDWKSSEGIIEVTGRVVKGYGGAWIVNLANHQDKHGFQVYLTWDQKVRIGPNLSDPDKKAGPMSLMEFFHPAIRPSGQWNTLRLIVKGKALEVFVNGQTVSEPIVMPFDFGPGMVSLGHKNAAGRARVEFKNMAIWPTTDPARRKMLSESVPGPPATTAAR